MFKVFTTAEIIDRFCDTYDSPDCDWMLIFRCLPCIYYCGGDGDGWMEDSENPWNIISSIGYDFEAVDDYLEGIKNDHPEDVLNNPDSAFILDIDKDKAKQIEASYGVICQPADTIGSLCKLTYGPVDKFQENLLDDRELKDEVANKRFAKRNKSKCWSELFDDRLREIQEYPSNAMIIVDRNLFAQRNDYTGGLFGLENLEDFLKATLPTKPLKRDYQVLIVNEEGCYPIKRGWYRNGIRLSEEERDAWIEEQTEKIHQEISSSISRIEKKLTKLRRYTVRISRLPAIRTPKGDPNINKFFDGTHDRKVLTNYYLLYASFSLSPYNVGIRFVSKENKIDLHYLFTTGLRDNNDSYLIRFQAVKKCVEGLLSDNHWNKCDYRIENRLLFQGYNANIARTPVA